MIKRLLLVLIFAGFYAASAQNLVLRGDYPDPSVVKIGDTYWATATTSNWLPAYPLLKSTDLINWETVGHVFKDKPQWVDYYFWAPEISYENGKVYIYYSAHKKDGNLCVGIASADKPEGPYTDHGPLICEEAGSIDAFPMRDENGKLYIIWKEDGNSVKKPTPIWAQELNEERTALTGEKTELFRNTEIWERNLVEGVAMIRKNDYFYALYAAAGCCGTGCTYVTGVARSKSLLGPWEKDPKNPLIENNGNWKCPGHGTAVEKDGRYFFMYHAYDTATHIFTGREGLLTEFRFTPDNWIELVPSSDSGTESFSRSLRFHFNDKSLDNSWQWSVFQKPVFQINKGRLHITTSSEGHGSILAQKTITGDYETTVKIHSVEDGASAGFGLIGDDNNYLAAFYNRDSIHLIQVKNGKETILVGRKANRSKKTDLKIRVEQGKYASFYVKNDPINTSPVLLTGLPPWDRAIRIGIISKGDPGKKISIESLKADFTD